MEFKIAITAEAQKDVRNIVDYISNVLMNPKAAIEFADKYKLVLSSLIHSPFMYQKFEYGSFNTKGYRKAVINNYLLIYKVDENEGCIYILRIIYGRRDYGSLTL